MPLEKRTRVEIFLPIRTDYVVYGTVTEWLAEELAFARGGSTLTTPFTGLYIQPKRPSLATKSTSYSAILIWIRMISMIKQNLLAYLEDVRLLLLEALREEDVLITYHSVTRIS